MRFRLIAALAVLCAWPSAAQAQPTGTYEALTVDDTARFVAGATMAGMSSCVAVLETGEIRWRNDDVLPTAAVGTPVAVGTAINFQNVDDLRRARFIRATATSGVLHVNCFARGNVGVTGSGGSAEVTGAVTTELTLQEPDDASIAAGSTADVMIGLTMGYNGTVWQRIQLDGSGNLKVADQNPTELGAGVSTASTIRVVEATDSASTLATIRAADAVEAIETKLATDAVEGQDATLYTSGPVTIGVASSTAPAAVSTGQMKRAWFNLNGAQMTQPIVGTIGGCTPNSSISTAAVLETEIKATAGQLYQLVITNLDATPVFARLYNDTAANTDQTDTPLQRFVVPTQGNGNGAGFVLPINVGQEYSTAITLRVTTGAADNDTGALTANEVLVSYCYK
jgi:hypothetical protein